MRRYSSIIFDFDGVIGDTMEDNFKAWAEAFSRFHITLDQHEYFLLEGMTAGKVAETILEKNYESTEDAEIIVQIKEKFYNENSSFAFFPGMLDLIDILKDRFNIGLVTGAGQIRLSESLSVEFMANFLAVVTGNDVENSKPDPEPYLLAIKMLKALPEECLVVENAPLGIQSAKTAGADCVAICTTLDKKYLSRADFIVENPDLLRTFFNNMLGGHE